jgi:ABC-type nitrate/sulfonate/bicarbonate transport system permease component
MTLGATWRLPRWAVRYAPPVLVFLAMLAAWEAYVWLRDVPPYILPSPSLVLETLVSDRGILFPALLVTLETTFGALAAAVLGGLASPSFSPNGNGWSVPSCLLRSCSR